MPRSGDHRYNDAFCFLEFQQWTHGLYYNYFKQIMVYTTIILNKLLQV